MKMDISKEWCEEAAKAEDGLDVGAGTIDAGLELVSARIHAHEIGDRLHSAYWMRSITPSHHYEYQLSEAHKTFAQLAEELGYEKPVLKADALKDRERET